MLYPYEFITDEDTNAAVIKYGENSTYRGEELVAFVLSYAKQIAEAHAGSVIKDCVITIPPYFNHVERAAMINAAAIAGLNVGNVQTLEFFENKNRNENNMNAVAVRATLSIEKEYAAAVREDSEFFITTRGVLGEPYIEIVTETYKGPAITPGATLRGVDPPRMDLVISRAMRLLKALTDLLEDPFPTVRLPRVPLGIVLHHSAIDRAKVGDLQLRHKV